MLGTEGTLGCIGAVTAEIGSQSCLSLFTFTKKNNFIQPTIVITIFQVALHTIFRNRRHDTIKKNLPLCVKPGTSGLVYRFIHLSLRKDTVCYMMPNILLKIYSV